MYLKTDDLIFGEMVENCQMGIKTDYRNKLKYIPSCALLCYIFQAEIIFPSSPLKLNGQRV